MAGIEKVVSVLSYFGTEEQVLVREACKAEMLEYFDLAGRWVNTTNTLSRPFDTESDRCSRDNRSRYHSNNATCRGADLESIG